MKAWKIEIFKNKSGGLMQKDSLDVVRGIGISLLFGAIIWVLLIWGGMFVWKTYIKPTESKISKVFDIKEESWNHLRFK